MARDVRVGSRLELLDHFADPLNLLLRDLCPAP